jgi:hypothetical protein
MPVATAYPETKMERTAGGMGEETQAGVGEQEVRKSDGRGDGERLVSGRALDPDVLVDLPKLQVEEVSLEIKDLQARVSLHANVLNLLQLRVGAEASLGELQLAIKGVEVQAQVKVKLDDLAEILDRVLTTIDRNPQIVEKLVEGIGQAVEQVGQGAGRAVSEIGEGASGAVQEVGRGAGSALGDVGRGAGSALGDVGRGAGSAVENVGQGAGEAVGDVGEGARSAAENVGQGARSAAENVGQGARSVTETVAENANQGEGSARQDRSQGGQPAADQPAQSTGQNAGDDRTLKRPE